MKKKGAFDQSGNYNGNFDPNGSYTGKYIKEPGTNDVIIDTEPEQDADDL
ncbi:MAG: hypothetical protein J1F36_03840 [Clostridiales bacterium]|nr:hypothetical protein [Clostridiales bacterium]